MCPVWSLLIPNLQYKLHTNAGLRLQALNRLWALSPHLPSWALTYLTTDEVNPAQNVALESFKAALQELETIVR